MNNTKYNFKITGTGSTLPAKKVTNDELAKYVDTSDEWISSRTGIRSRYIATTETATSMAVSASMKALEDANVEGKDIDLIIVATVSADNCFPSTACEIQAAIGAKGAIAFDINAACSGFLYGLQMAQGYFNTGNTKRALIVGCEVLSKMMDFNDRGTCVLFGDGAGAAVIERTEGDPVYFEAGADGAGGECLKCSSRKVHNPFVENDKDLDYTHMNGQDVFKFAVRTVPAIISRVLEGAGIAPSQIDVFLLHQANLRIIESVAKRLGEPIEKFPTTLEECGNISAASIPILLDVVYKEGKVKRGQKVVLAGFGAGLTWSACMLEF